MSNEIKIDEFHKHELLDRIHCVQTMFEELIRHHPAAALIKQDIEATDVQLSKLYDLAGAVRFN